MTKPPARDRRHIEVEPLPAITLGGRRDGKARSTRWGLILIWYMRILAALWMVGGLMQWALILGVGTADPNAFDALPDGVQLAVAFFAVIDLLAAIGLWLTAAWGGVVWIFAAAAQIVLPILAPGVGGLTGLVGQALFAGFIALYFLFALLAARERDGP